MRQRGYCLVAVVVLGFASLVSCFDISLLWDVPDDAQDITQASALIQLNSSTSPVGTEWIGIGWQHGALSLQKFGNGQLVVIMQVRSPEANSTVRAGRVTEYSTAHYIDKKKEEGGNGMYLQSNIDENDAHNAEYSLKIIAHYNMVAKNTIYQGLWSDGQVWTYMGSLIVQHPKNESIKEGVAKALEDAAHFNAADWLADNYAARNIVVGDGDARASGAADKGPSIPIKDPLSRAKLSETLATCEITRDSAGHIRPVCKFIRQLPMVPSFPQPFSGVRRTSSGKQKFERAGIFKNLSLKSRLGQVYDIPAVRCISHNRQSADIASCQRDPNTPEFIISIDGLSPVEARER
ncbi:hypothetical protein H4R24_002999 [Coemansia sp. RSA 988]|nr:hypothetical protein H4R24_002999 [Coemansia sp. RSA 988]